MEERKMYVQQSSSSQPGELKRFRELTGQIKQYEELLGVVYWDMRTGAPRKGIGLRSEAVGTLSAEMFRLSTSEEMGALIDKLTSPEVLSGLDPIDRRLIEETNKEYSRNRKLPPELYREYVVLTSQAESAWEVAKKDNDFPGFVPYLEKIVDYNRQFIELWGVKSTPYDTLVDMYEPGMTATELDRLFGELRSRLVPLAEAIAKEGKRPDSSFLEGAFDKEGQKQFSKFILNEMGYDFEAGRLDESVHPFATGLSPGDVRITTRFLPNDVTSALFGSIHEGGHSLYEQNIDSELAGTLLCSGTSMGIHESQSRLWENMIGRSRGFWQKYLPKLQQIFPDLQNVSAESFYRGINIVEPSLIRVEADELTYNLHIMIRFEIEKMLFNEGLSPRDLPEVWNAKYKEALGIVPPDDAHGVLQDVLWSGGAFGYFPSYSLGNMYGAQIMNTARQKLPDLDNQIAAGQLYPLKEWLTEQVYRHGKMLKPAEIIERISGQSLKSTFLCDYLESKYREIYQL
jgi:carboxypeptidase Taq